MSLFKVLRGSEANLPTKKTDGWAYFCTDTGSFWIDYQDANNTLVRSKISANFADKLRYIEDGKTVELDPSEIATHTDLDNKVNKVTGKGLSSNDLTNTLKGNYDSAYTHSQSAHAPTNAQANIIETVKVNGTAQTITNKTVNITVPTGSLASKSKVSESDLDSTLASKLSGKADSSHTHDDIYFTETEIDNKLSGYVPTSRKVNGKELNTDVTLSASDVGALSSDTEIPSALADLTTDSTHRTVTDNEKAAWNAKSDFSGNYNDLTNKPTIPSVAGLATETYVDNAVSTKVDKVTGKGLSTNDLTNALKGNYDSAYTHSQAAHAPVGAQANVIESVKVNGTALTVTGKAVNVTVPTGALASKSKVSESDLDTTLATKLNGKADSDHNHDDVYYTETEIDTKLSGKANTSHSHNDVYYTETEVDTKLDNKVDKVTGKGLSTNDYTTTEKNKLAGIAEGANKYVLPSATDSVVGGMKLYTATGTNTAGTMTQKAITDALAGKSGTGHNHDSVYSKLGHTHTAAEVGATTQVYVDNQIKDAKSYTDTKVAGLVDSAPETLNTLNELAAALGDDPNFATTMATELGTKATTSALNTHASSNIHITSTERTNWTAAKTHADSAHAPSNAERNIIVGIQKNGTDVTVNSTTRKVNITVPTKTSELTNNSDFATNASVTSVKDELQANIDGKANSSHNHAASHITSGTLSSDRLPTVPVAKGGTGATTAAGALTNLGLTATAAELNVLDGITATTAELNKLDGVTATTTELNYVDGVTSNIQTQLNGKASTTHAHDMKDLEGFFIELNNKGTKGTGHGGYLDFHYDGSGADYTSRIIESASGSLSLNGVKCASSGVTCTSVNITNGATKNKTSGYVKLNNGMILQWGTVSSLANGNSKWVTFPIAFPTAVGGAPMLTGNYGNSFGYELHANDVAAAGFTIVKRGGSSTTGTDTVSWLAVGW